MRRIGDTVKAGKRMGEDKMRQIERGTIRQERMTWTVITGRKQ